MEPFRPLVDRIVRQQVELPDAEDSLSPKTKEKLIAPLLGRFCLNNQMLTLFDVVSHLTTSLVQFYAKETDVLELPLSIAAYEEEKPF